MLKKAGLTNQQITNCSIKDEYAEKISIQFAFYYFFKLGEWCKDNISQGGGLSIIGTEKLKQFLYLKNLLKNIQNILNCTTFRNFCSFWDFVNLFNIDSAVVHTEHQRVVLAEHGVVVGTLNRNTS